MPMIELTPTHTIMYNEVMFDGSIKTDGFIKVGAYVAGTTGWSHNCTIGLAGYIAAVGHITGPTLSITGTLSIVSPYVSGVQAGLFAGWIAIYVAEANGA